MFRGQLTREENDEPEEGGQRPPPISIPDTTITEIKLHEDGVLEVRLATEAVEEIDRVVGDAGRLEVQILRSES